MDIVITPLPEDFLDRVRHRNIDDQQQPVRRLVASGGEPCRDVLRRARPGEALILASFCPFSHPSPYKEFGPIFLLAEPTNEPVIRTHLPIHRGVPEDYFGHEYVIRSYSYAGDILDAQRIATLDGPHHVVNRLGRPEVAFVDIRFPIMACFACRIQRR